MKQFNLKSYIANPRKVITRDGRNVRILCVDAKGDYPVVALIPDGEGEYKRDSPEAYTEDGCNYSGRISYLDLFFAPEIHEGWANVFGGADGNSYLGDSHGNSYVGDSHIFKSKEEAEKEGKKWKDYIATVRIEWEE